MGESLSFYQCKVCSNLVGLIKNAGGALACCGQPMAKLEANTTDAAREKHVPVVEKKAGKLSVKVGSADHPMTPEHFIEWIAVTSGKGTQRIALSPSDAPKAEFVDVENPAVYAYCNLHGLWKA